MESSDMKNMVVLKNLPSNMVEEAIIIFKQSQKIKQKELIERSKQIDFTEPQNKSKEYIVKEAEMLVKDYINKIENKKITSKADLTLKHKYKNLKNYSIVSTALLLISLIINFI